MVNRTKADKAYCRERLIQARAQRFIALENAFKTIDCFAIPALDPGHLKNYEELKSVLLTVYSDFDKKELKNFKF